jgi:hypothetical protein
MGFLATIDTFLVFKITEVRYRNRTIAFFASLIFAILPLPHLFRWLLLETIELPFLLLSILFAVSYNVGSIHRLRDNTLIVLTSGIFLGLTTFTKILAVALIPLVGYLIYSNSKVDTKRWRVLGFWFIPVIFIPAMWPIHAMYSGHLDDWINGLNYHIHRENVPLAATITEIASNYPLLLVVAILSIILTAIKRDYFPGLWVIPLLILLAFIPYVTYIYFIPLIPAFCISFSHLIVSFTSYLSKKVKNKKLKILSTAFVVVIVIYAFTSTTAMILINETSSSFEAAAVVAQYVKGMKTNGEMQIIIIASPNYFWILRYIFNLNFVEKDYTEYPYETPVHTENVILIADSEFQYYLSYSNEPNPEISKRVHKMYELYATNSTKAFKIDEATEKIFIYVNR